MSALVMGGLGIKTADAQLGIRINLHLGTPVIVNQPVFDDYYYLPEVEAYYSVGERAYYYQDNGRWISAAYLPGRYHDFDWRSAKRYEIRGNRPYMQHDVYRGRFGGYGNRNDYYARAYPNRDRNYNDRGQYGNRDWNQNRNDDRRDDRNQGGYNQPNRNQGGYNQQTPDRNQGGYNQQTPDRNQGGYNQQNPGRNQGVNQQQPSQGQGQQGGGRGNGQNQSGQPANQNGGDRGNNAGQHFAANKMGVIQDRGDFARPVRN